MLAPLALARSNADALGVIELYSALAGEATLEITDPETNVSLLAEFGLPELPRDGLHPIRDEQFPECPRIADQPPPQQFRLPIDDALRSVLRREYVDHSSPAEPLRPTEVQAMIRAGASAAEAAQRAGWPVEKVHRYEGPILAEREHIAQLARYRYPESAIPQGLRKTFARMGELDTKIAGKLVELLRTQDPAFIDDIRDIDDAIDELHAKVFEKVLSDKVNTDTTGVVDATLASRYHERFGDHAVNISRQVNYFLRGALL